MAQMNQIFLTMIFTATVVTSLVPSADAASRLYENGLTVRIHSAEDIQSMISQENGERTLRHATLGSLELLDGVDDPRLPRQGVSEFLPIDAETVFETFADLHIDGVELTVDVFLLPAPPAEILSSFARRQAIVLSPSFGPVHPETVAELVVHEFGHVLTWAFFDRSADAWNRYMSLRGLDPVFNGPTAAHADRAREILAEDLRYLIGGDLATQQGRIENSRLDLPDEVDGLDAFLRTVISGRPYMGPMLTASAFPNPCNPLTVIQLNLDESVNRDASSSRLQILDMRGRLVRTLQGGRLENSILSISWDGSGQDGRRVASGQYFFRIGWVGYETTGTVAVVR